LIEWFNMRPDGAIRGKWRILDGKVESNLDHKFRAPRWYPPPGLIKTHVGWVRMNKHLIMYWRIWDLWGPTNLVALTVAELDDTPPYLRMYNGLVFRPPTVCPPRHTRGRWH
jgi:hypothetical protein